jgi:hypothetical protein
MILVFNIGFMVFTVFLLYKFRKSKNKGTVNFLIVEPDKVWMLRKITPCLLLVFGGCFRALFVWFPRFDFYWQRHFGNIYMSEEELAGMTKDFVKTKHEARRMRTADLQKLQNALRVETDLAEGFKTLPTAKFVADSPSADAEVSFDRVAKNKAINKVEEGHRSASNLSQAWDEDSGNRKEGQGRIEKPSKGRRPMAISQPKPASGGSMAPVKWTEPAGLPNSPILTPRNNLPQLSVSPGGLPKTSLPKNFFVASPRNNLPQLPVSPGGLPKTSLPKTFFLPPPQLLQPAASAPSNNMLRSSRLAPLVVGRGSADSDWHLSNLQESTLDLSPPPSFGRRIQTSSDIEFLKVVDVIADHTNDLEGIHEVEHEDGAEQHSKSALNYTA